MSQAATETGTGRLTRVVDWLRAHFGPGDELAGFSRDDLRDMASDLSLTESDLVALVDHGTDNTVLMLNMMRARGLDPKLLQQSFVTLLRDVERVCTRCNATRRCARELAAGSAAAHCHEYCPNAGTFDDLVEYSMGR